MWIRWIWESDISYHNTKFLVFFMLFHTMFAAYLCLSYFSYIYMYYYTVYCISRLGFQSESQAYQISLGSIGVQIKLKGPVRLFLLILFSRKFLSFLSSDRQVYTVSVCVPERAGKGYKPRNILDPSNFQPHFLSFVSPSSTSAKERDS